MRRADLLQWFGLLGGAIAWATHLVLGYGVTVADCSRGGAPWGLDLRVWEIVLMAAAAAVVVLAELAALTVYLETRGIDHEGPPPDGRRHFFASAAVIGNVLFLGAVVLAGAAALSQSCRAS
jgi:hypothetical protein